MKPALGSRPRALGARWRAGVTLTELMVVIVILGVMAAVTTLAIRRAPEPEPVERAMAAVEAARSAALRDGTRHTVVVTIGGERWLATAFPDGRVVTDAPLAVDRLSGRPADAAR